MMVLSFRPLYLRQGLASRMLIVGLVVAGIVATVPVLASAQTQNSQALLDRINRLERDIRTLNQQISKVPPTVSGAHQSSEMQKLDMSGAGKKSVLAPQFAPNESTASRLTVRIDALEQELRIATGQSESIAHSIDLVGAKLDKLIVDLDYRLSTLEGTTPGTNAMTKPFSTSPTGIGTPSVTLPRSPGSVSKAGALAPVPASPGTLGVVPQSNLDQIVSKNPTDVDANTVAKDAPKDARKAFGKKVVNAAPQLPVSPIPTARVGGEPVPAPAPENKITVRDQYKAAFNLTRQARYGEAEIAFKAFIDTNGNDPLVGNARYWLGETYYVRKDFMQSAQTFFQAYQQFPKGVKAPDSLLKLGMSMAGLEKTVEACATFGKLKKEFGADLKPNIERALNKQTKKLACK